MASFTQKTGNDLEVQIDGYRIEAPDGVPFTIPDEFADQLRAQDIYVENITKTSAAAVVAPTVTEPTPEGN